MHTIIITADDIRRICHAIGIRDIMDDLIQRLVLAFRDHDDATYSTPTRDGFNYVDPHLGLIEWMPVLERGNQAMVKLVGYHPESPSRFGLPTILSTISSYDTKTGHLTGLIDGTFLTALRTGAASAVASRFLAAPGSSCLGIIGCGAQGLTQLHGVLSEFDLQTVMYHDIDRSAMWSFPQRASCFTDNTSMEFVAASIEDVIRSADILCTATSIESEQGPLFEDLEVKPHLHVNAVGSDFEGKLEIPLPLLRRSLVCPDFLAQAVKEGECQQLDAKEIGPDIVTVTRCHGEYSEYQHRTTVFDSTGWALEDYVVATMFRDMALALELGTKLEIESCSHDPKDPYAFLTLESKQLLDQQ